MGCHISVVQRGLQAAVVALSLALGAGAVGGCDREQPMVGELPIEGMTCDSCVQGITHQLSQVEGVTHCEVSLEQEMATVEYDGAKVAPEQLVEAVEAIGYDAGEPKVHPRPRDG